MKFVSNPSHLLGAFRMKRLLQKIGSLMTSTHLIRLGWWEKILILTWGKASHSFRKHVLSSMVIIMFSCLTFRSHLTSSSCENWTTTNQWVVHIWHSRWTQSILGGGIELRDMGFCKFQVKKDFTLLKLKHGSQEEIWDQKFIHSSWEAQ